MIHTVFPIVESLTQLFKDNIDKNSIKLYNIVDDSILHGIAEKEDLNYKTVNVVYNHVKAAEAAGSNIVLVTCSSISEVVDIIRPLFSIPIIKIDDAMTDEAVKLGGTLGVVATSNTTLKPTISQLKKKAINISKKIEIKSYLCSEAYKSLLDKNDPEEHDNILYKFINKIANNVDVIILAQASMARLLPKLKNEYKLPILTSPQSGIKKTLDVLKNIKI